MVNRHLSIASLVNEPFLPFFKCVSLKSLPWQVATQKVHVHVTQCLQVITSGLLLAQVSVNTHVPEKKMNMFKEN